MKKQKEAVFEAITQIKGELTGSLSKEEISQVAEIVTSGILAGEVSFSDDSRAKYDTDAKVFGYVKGMVKNWITKSPILNGGNKYAPKTKRGPQGDATLTALKNLLAQNPDNTEVQEALDAHLAAKEEAKAAKKVKSINKDALPDHLKKFVS